MSHALIGNCRLIDLKVRGDERGSLVAIEEGADVPFAIKRVYYFYGTTPGVDRGFHAHRRLRQLAVAVNGSCTMVLDNGATRQEVRLDDPATGLLIGPSIWREITEISADCVLMVLADAVYDEGDYIRDHATFKAAAAR